LALLGSLGASLELDLNDENQSDGRSPAERSDHRFHLDEMRAVIDSHDGNPLCIFDLLGRLFARLSFEVQVKIPRFQKSISKEWTLLDFKLGCMHNTGSNGEDINFDLANLDGTKLVLTSIDNNNGAYVSMRAGTNHLDGDKIDIFPIDKNNNPADGKETLRVQKNLYTEDFGPGES